MADKSRAFQTAKNRVFTRTFQPAGFVKGAYLFARQTIGQVHGVQFQASRYGGSYFVNVAFHYEFLPPLFHMSNNVLVPVQKFDLTDFMLHSRLEDLMPASYPAEWSYDSAPSLEEQLDKNAKDAIGVLGALSEKWRDPAVFLELLPPKLLDDDYRIALADPDAPRPFRQAIGPGWVPVDYFKMGFCLCVIALRVGRVDVAKEYFKILEFDRRGRGTKAVAELQRQMAAADAKGAT